MLSDDDSQVGGMVHCSVLGYNSYNITNSHQQHQSLGGSVCCGECVLVLVNNNTYVVQCSNSNYHSQSVALHLVIW